MSRTIVNVGDVAELNGGISDIHRVTFANGVVTYIPKGNHKVQAWIDAGNTPTPYVAPVKTWEENRQAEYAKLNQFEMQFDDQRDSTTTWVDAVNAIKVKYPKP
tara:strand:+ start:112 stop:423 length:312 start_codon:yes stop_codon:yes gene_type:complete